MFDIWVMFHGESEHIECPNVRLARFIWDALAKEAMERDDGSIVLNSARP